MFIGKAPAGASEMKPLLDRSIAIIGFGELPNVKGEPRNALDLAADVTARALASCGLGPQHIDGVALHTPLSEEGDPFWSNLLAETLGLRLSWLQTTDLGGATAIANVARAAAAIYAGQCEAVLCVNADAPATQYLASQTGHRAALADPLGWAGPVTGFGLLAHAYASRYGWPEAALAHIAMQSRASALLNVNACASLRMPMALDDYRKSRMVSDPLRMLDCVMRCDGANAVIVTSAAKARSLGLARWVSPIAYRELTNHDPRQQSLDLLASGFATVGPAALMDAGLVLADIDSLQLYDDFTFAVLLQLEELGFCARGEGEQFVLSRDFSPRGNLPMNTGGGQLSAGQCGLAGGGIGLVEAVRQLMRAAQDRQIPSARTALVTGLGVLPYAGNWGTSATLILEANDA